MMNKNIYVISYQTLGWANDIAVPQNAYESEADAIAELDKIQLNLGTDYTKVERQPWALSFSRRGKLKNRICYRIHCVRLAPEN